MIFGDAYNRYEQHQAHRARLVEQRAREAWQRARERRWFGTDNEIEALINEIIVEGKEFKFRYLIVWDDPSLGGAMAEVHEQDSRRGRDFVASKTFPVGISEKRLVQRHYAKEKNCSVIVRVRMK